jgi:hypothetical protein
VGGLASCFRYGQRDLRTAGVGKPGKSPS